MPPTRSDYLRYCRRVVRREYLTQWRLASVSQVVLLYTAHLFSRAVSASIVGKRSAWLLDPRRLAEPIAILCSTTRQPLSSPQRVGESANAAEVRMNGTILTLF